MDIPNKLHLNSFTEVRMENSLAVEEPLGHIRTNRTMPIANHCPLYQTGLRRPSFDKKKNLQEFQGGMVRSLSDWIMGSPAPLPTPRCRFHRPDIQRPRLCFRPGTGRAKGQHRGARAPAEGDLEPGEIFQIRPSRYPL